MIPAIPKITVEPRPLNALLWELDELKRTGRSTRFQDNLLDCLCRALESGQDTDRRNV